MKVIKLEYRMMDLSEYHANAWNGIPRNHMKFHLTVEIEGKRYTYETYEHESFPYVEILHIAKREIGRLILDKIV